MEQSVNELIAVLSGLGWATTGCGVVADFSTDDIAAFGKLVAFGLGVPPTILDIPDGYALVFHKRDFPRLAGRGLRFPGHAELDLVYECGSILPA